MEGSDPLHLMPYKPLLTIRKQTQYAQCAAHILELFFLIIEQSRLNNMETMETILLRQLNLFISIAWGNHYKPLLMSCNKP